jgi:hypothetical protein
MKMRHFVLLLLVLVGCSKTIIKRPASLTAEQARMIARNLANEKAQALYGRQPFGDDAPARLVQGQWRWSGRGGYGAGDMEATVILTADGSVQSVNVMLLDSRALF